MHWRVMELTQCMIGLMALCPLKMQWDAKNADVRRQEPYLMKTYLSRKIHFPVTSNLIQERHPSIALSSSVRQRTHSSH